PPAHSGPPLSSRSWRRRPRQPVVAAPWIVSPIGPTILGLEFGALQPSQQRSSADTDSAGGRLHVPMSEQSHDGLLLLACELCAVASHIGLPESVSGGSGNVLRSNASPSPLKISSQFACLCR